MGLKGSGCQQTGLLTWILGCKPYDNIRELHHCIAGNGAALYACAPGNISSEALGTVGRLLIDPSRLHGHYSDSFSTNNIRQSVINCASLMRGAN